VKVVPVDREDLYTTDIAHVSRNECEIMSKVTSKWEERAHLVRLICPPEVTHIVSDMTKVASHAQLCCLHFSRGNEGRCEYCRQPLSDHIEKKSRVVMLVMEYLKYGDLFDLIVRRRHMEKHGMWPIDTTQWEGIVASLFQQIVEGVMFLHDSLHIAHLDLKPENIGIDDDLNVKIFDFGGSVQDVVDSTRSDECSVPRSTSCDDVAKGGEKGLDDIAKLSNHFTKVEWDRYSGHKKNLTCGDSRFLPPENVFRQPFKLFAGDIWSVGTILLRLLVGNVHFGPPALHRQFSLSYHSFCRRHAKIGSNFVGLIGRSVFNILHLCFAKEQERCSASELLKMVDEWRRSIHVSDADTRKHLRFILQEELS
jgi:serine/threonine protein kinase